MGMKLVQPRNLAGSWETYKDAICRLLEHLTESPEVVEAIAVPSNPVTLTDTGEGLEAVRVGDCLSLTVHFLFVLLIVSMIWIEGGRNADTKPGHGLAQDLGVSVFLEGFFETHRDDLELRI